MNSYRKEDKTPRQQESEKREKRHLVWFGLGLIGRAEHSCILVGKFLALYIIVNMAQGCSNLDKQDKLVINAESCDRLTIEYIEAAEGYKVEGPPIGTPL